MNAHSPYIDAAGNVTLVPRSLHNSGSGVDELGDLVLNTRDITRLDDLVDDCLVGWWTGVAGAPSSSDERESLRNLYSALVLPAAVHASADLDDVRALVGATEYSDPKEVPDVDVLIHPDAVARALGVAVAGM